MKKKDCAKTDKNTAKKEPYEAPRVQYSEVRWEDVVACSDMSNYTEKMPLIDPSDLKW